TIFNPGDTPILSFQLYDNGTPPALVTDLITNSAWSGTFIVAGPTSNPQRVFGGASGGLSMKTTGALAVDGGTYTYTPAGVWPATNLTPVNGDAGVQAN